LLPSIVVVRDGKHEFITTADGKSNIPSYVAFTSEGEVLVGEEAKKQIIFNPENTVYLLKNLLGRKYDDVILQGTLKKLPFTVVEKDGWPCIKIRTKREVKVRYNKLISVERHISLSVFWALEFLARFCSLGNKSVSFSILRNNTSAA